MFARARNNDPTTSMEAAASIPKEMHYDIILRTLYSYGALGKDGIARHSGLRPDQVWRRLSELNKLNLIRPTGKLVKSDAGRNEQEWDIYGD